MFVCVCVCLCGWGKGSTMVGRLLLASLACGRPAAMQALAYSQDLLCKLCVYLILGCVFIYMYMF